MSEIKFCPYCSREVVEHAKFCYACGGDLGSISGTPEHAALKAPTDRKPEASPPRDKPSAPAFCRYCGASVAPEAQFCRKCGKNLTSDVKESAPPAVHSPVEPATHSPVDRRDELLNESYRRSGQEILRPFEKTVVNGVECFSGKTRHRDGRTLEITLYPAPSFEHARQLKEQLSNGYQARGYATYKTADNTWMGFLEGTLISVAAEQASALRVPTTIVIATPI
jgi:hypothetical protein